MICRANLLTGFYASLYMCYIYSLTLNNQCSHHIETNQMICRATLLTAFYMMGTLGIKRLI